MKDQNSAEAFLPSARNLAELRQSIQSCRGCDLYKHATQAVFGEGDPHSSLVFVGEQPGDREDLQGRPFVGPSGLLLDKALGDAGIARQDVYVTNAVKHFKWFPRGKRRLHQKPNAQELMACKPWLRAELGIIKPLVLVCLGVTAASAVFGRLIRIGEMRGKFEFTPLCAQTFVTLHPSAILRETNDEARDRKFTLFVEDLRKISALIEKNREKT